MKLSRFIKHLQSIQKEAGDVEVVLAADSEGNSFGSTDAYSFGWEDEKYIIIYPNYEGDTPEACVDWEENKNPRRTK